MVGPLTLDATAWITDGISTISSIFTFMEGNSLIKIMLGVAIATMAVGAVMSIFFRSR